MASFYPLVVCSCLIASLAAPAGAGDAPVGKPSGLKGMDHVRKTIYHSPEKPGFTSWVGAWKMPDDSLMICFTQATGPVKDRPRAPQNIQKKLNWPPGGDARYDMTGLDLKNVHL